MGDSVRIAMTRRPFKKGYTGQWSEELFVVSEKLRTIPTTYGVKDLVDEQIDGTFYHHLQELQLVRVKQDKVYTVERISKKRKRGNTIEYFVEWKGYGDKFNTWIIKEDIIAWYSHLASRHHGSILYQTAKQQLHEHLPRNRTSSYVTKLSDEIHLTGRWEIGLKEIQYPLSWFKIEEWPVTLP